MKYRSYQEEVHTAILKHRAQKKPKPALVVLPTAAGKTHCIARAIHSSGNKTIIICPSKEVLSQNYNKYVALGEKASIYCVGLGKRELGDVTFATLPSIKNMADVFKNMGVTDLIIDEAHLNTDPSTGMFKRFLTQLKPKYVLGFTATPFRNNPTSDANGFSYIEMTIMTKTTPKFFSEIIHVTQIQELVANNYWSKVNLDIKDMDLADLELNTSGSDFTEASILKVNIKNRTNSRIYKELKELYYTKKHILVFTDSTDTCIKMSNALNERFIPNCSDYIVSKEMTPAVATEKVNKFLSGKTKILCVMNTLTTGFDFPELDCVIMGRPTNSLITLYQIYGRIVRISEGKNNPTFIDYGGNFDRFGKIEDLTIEDYLSHGWGVFNKERLLSSVFIGGNTVTKSMIKEAKVLKVLPPKADEYTNFPILIGKFKGKTVRSVPMFYVKFLKEKLWNNLSPEIKKDVDTRLAASGLLK